MNPRPPEIPPHKLISTLRGYNLLPAIIFMPTRRKCDESALEVANDQSQKTDPERQKKRQELFDQFASESPEIKVHKHAKILLNAGVASHHAGHIPAWKLVIEKMMSGGLLNAIFATSTVAAGVDFPARTGRGQQCRHPRQRRLAAALCERAAADDRACRTAGQRQRRLCRPGPRPISESAKDRRAFEGTARPA